MIPESSSPAAQAVDRIYREESRIILATLIRILGNFELAEDALQDAFASAIEQWPEQGIPSNPRAWLISAGRFKAIDALRRRARFNASLSKLAEKLDEESLAAADFAEETVKDDQLRLIFTCCHPALPADARVALTLREVCDLTTEEIARAFLSSTPTVAQRIVRAKAKIRQAGIPYEIPSPEDLNERLATVLQVIYLVFNEGYSASHGNDLVRADLSAEAIRLGRALLGLLPEPEVAGLLGLMLLQESRREARISPDGDIILLEDQDRTLWNRDQISEGLTMTERASSRGEAGPYALQAAIASEHARAPAPSSTNWPRIVELYKVLARIEPSPVVELNLAVGIALRDGPGAGLAIIDQVMAGGELDSYHLAHSARADMYRRLGRREEARSAYGKALSLARLEPEKRFLQKRLDELDRVPVENVEI